MNVHKNTRLTPRGRERIIQQVASGQTSVAVAEAAGVCQRTIRKGIDRYQREGLAGLQDRSSRPHRLRRPTRQAVVEEIEQLRRQRWTGKQIAAETGVSPATVSRILRRLGLNKLSALEPAEPRVEAREGFVFKAARWYFTCEFIAVHENQYLRVRPFGATTA